ncbi:MAG: DUF805 domain-containing protein [Thalassolituus sp.]|jgi:uncharacterized membrane protein YhaH (DUF805 family)|uniref:DUF805 domain-containing protein n=1 Tax=Thalassolituus sp. TaxID=2030822 RepID=UPI003981A969
MNIWTILGIAPTDDKKSIKRAYIAQLKVCHPEENPEDFMRLREAFDRANSHAEQGVFAENNEEVNSYEAEVASSVKSDFEVDIDPLKEAMINPSLDKFFKDHISYSDIVLSNVEPTPRSVSTEAPVELNPYEDYQNLKQILDDLITDPIRHQNLDEWQILLSHRLFLSLSYRIEFSALLRQKLKTELGRRGCNVKLSPEAVSLITGFVFDTAAMAKHDPISNADLTLFEDLQSSAEMFSEAREGLKFRFIPRYLGWLFFSTKGRLSRLEFSIAMLILLAIPFFVIKGISNSASSSTIGDIFHRAQDSYGGKQQKESEILLAKKSEGSKGRSLAMVKILVIFLLFSWIVASLCIKRLHDAGKSALLLLFIFIPYAGFFVILFSIYSQPDYEANEYGKARNLFRPSIRSFNKALRKIVVSYIGPEKREPSNDPNMQGW